MPLCLSVVCHKGMNAHISFWLLDITSFQHVSVCYKVTNAFVSLCRFGTYSYRILCLSHNRASAFDTLWHVATTYLFTDGASQKETLALNRNVFCVNSRS